MINRPRAHLQSPSRSDSIKIGSASLPPLNSAHEVNKIVRKFASDVIKNTFAGEMTREDFVSWIQTRVQALSRLFLGEFTMEANQYQRGIWNTPENLGRFLTEHLSEPVNRQDSVKALFNQLGTAVMKIVKNSQQSDEISKQKLEAACVHARDLLLGLGTQNLQ